MSSSRAARVRRPPGRVETGGRPRAAGRRRRCRPGRRRRPMPRTTTRFEAQAPGAGEGGHEDAVAEAAVGQLRGVEPGFFEHGADGPLETRRGRRGPTRRRARPAPAPSPAPVRPRRARAAGHDRRVGVEVVVEELDGPGGVRRPRSRGAAAALVDEASTKAARASACVGLFGRAARPGSESLGPLRRSAHHAGLRPTARPTDWWGPGDGRGPTRSARSRAKP